MNELLSALSLWLIDYLIVATAFLAASALALWFTRQPSQRMATAWGTMVGLSVLAVATALPAWPRIDVRQWTLPEHVADSAPLPAPEVPIDERVVNQPERTALPASEPALLPALASTPLPVAAIGTWQGSITLTWLAAAMLAVAWIVLGALQAWRLLWTAGNPPSWVHAELIRIVGGRKLPRLKTSMSIGSAVALGALRPAILLPTNHVRDEYSAGVQAALAHEWAHIRHGDLWMLAWQRLLLPLLAAHPLFWLLRRQIRADQELLADIAAAGERPVEYAEALLAWAREAGSRTSAPLVALAMWENPQTVSRRIQMILDPKNPVAQPGSRWWRVALLAVLAGMVISLSIISVRPQSAVGQDKGPAAPAQPAAIEPSAQAIDQIKEALEKLRTEAAQNAKLREDMQRETAHLKQRISDLMAQLAWLRSVANQDAKDKVPDAEFIRRVYLDLTGTVPAAADVKLFLDSDDASKREKLIDKLLGDAKVADHWAKVWKEAIAGRDPSPVDAKLSPAAEAAAESTVTVFHLRYTKAEDAVKLASELWPAIGKPNANILADPRTNSLIVQGPPQAAEVLRAILKVIDQAAAPSERSQPREASTYRTASAASYDPRTQRRLLEIDLAQAEAEMELAAAELDEVKKLGNAVSASELRKKEAALRYARLKRERAGVLLEAAAAPKDSAARSPLNAVEQAIVPPKNLHEKIWQTLGLGLGPAADDDVKKVNPAFRGGLVVINVRQGSPADDRGLLKGDILVGLGRWEMRSLENVVYALENEDLKQGELSFHILRDGKVLVGRLSLSRSELDRTPNPPADNTRSVGGDDLATKIRLAEIDLKDAQIKLDAEELKLKRMMEIVVKNPSSVSQAEQDVAKLAASQARIAVERAQTVLEGLKAQAAQPPRR